MVCSPVWCGVVCMVWCGVCVPVSVCIVSVLHMHVQVCWEGMNEHMCMHQSG